MVIVAASVVTRNGFELLVPAGMTIVGEGDPPIIIATLETTVGLHGAVANNLIAPIVALVPAVNCSVSFTLLALFTIELAGILHQAE